MRFGAELSKKGDILCTGFILVVIPCEGYKCGNPIDGYEYECGYCDKTGICIDCGECICNFGNINPKTGKEINFLLKILYDKKRRNQWKQRMKKSMTITQ